MTFYNSRNKDGFIVDGQMTENENAFDKGFCSWEMVTGSSGSFLRVIDPLVHFQDIDFPIEMLVESWYYDDASPIGTGDRGAPLFINGWSMCSALTNNQVRKKLQILWMIFCAQHLLTKM